MTSFLERMLAEWPASVREPLIEYHLRSLRKSLEEMAPHARRNPEGELWSIKSAMVEEFQTCL